MKLLPDFYQQTHTKKIARQLLGKILYSHIDGVLTGGIITETEAYEGIHDKACHAWNNRRTKRTEPMYATGGIAYVYFCYGIHHMFNVVTHKEEQPHAVLIRSIYPTTGIKAMEERKKAKHSQKNFSAGPGNVCKILGITLQHNNLSLQGNCVWIADENIYIKPLSITSTPRSGIDYAGEDANRLNRFVVNPQLFSSE